MKLSALAKECGGRLIKDAEVKGLCVDSRVAGEGDLFFCYRGTREDSHAYAETAAARGASLVTERELPLPCGQLVVPDGRAAMTAIAAAFCGHPEKKLRFAGVTGTNGKTTTCAFLRSILQAAGRKVGLIGTLGALYADRSVPPDLTTPDPISLFSLLADMRRAGTEDVVMEVSAHALALGKVKPILFDVAVFTNLTRDHLDFFGDMEKYGRAKKLLFLPAQSRFGVLNGDDPFSRELRTLPSATYALDSPADAFAVTEEEGLGGTRAVLNLEDKLVEAEIHPIGRHNVLNALAAAAAARVLGVSPEAIARGIDGVKQVDGRLERVASFRGADIFVDFAHTPDGLEKSLSCLKEHCIGRLIALFGCGGDRDEGKRAQMGETAARLADFCVLTSDNPRFEDPCAILAAIEEGVRRVSREYVAIEEREKGLRYALGMLEEGDVLLVAGKGAETYQEIMGIKYDYSDREAILSLIGTLS